MLLVDREHLTTATGCGLVRVLHMSKKTSLALSDLRAAAWLWERLKYCGLSSGESSSPKAVCRKYAMCQVNLLDLMPKVRVHSIPFLIDSSLDTSQVYSGPPPHQGQIDVACVASAKRSFSLLLDPRNWRIIRDTHASFWHDLLKLSWRSCNFPSSSLLCICLMFCSWLRQNAWLFMGMRLRAACQLHNVCML